MTNVEAPSRTTSLQPLVLQRLNQKKRQELQKALQEKQLQPDEPEPQPQKIRRHKIIRPEDVSPRALKYYTPRKPTEDTGSQSQPKLLRPTAPEVAHLMTSPERLEGSGPAVVSQSPKSQSVHAEHVEHSDAPVQKQAKQTTAVNTSNVQPAPKVAIERKHQKLPSTSQEKAAPSPAQKAAAENTPPGAKKTAQDLHRETEMMRQQLQQLLELQKQQQELLKRKITAEQRRASLTGQLLVKAPEKLQQMRTELTQVTIPAEHPQPAQQVPAETTETTVTSIQPTKRTVSKENSSPQQLPRSKHREKQPVAEQSEQRQRRQQLQPQPSPEASVQPRKAPQRRGAESHRSRQPSQTSARPNPEQQTPRRSEAKSYADIHVLKQQESVRSGAAGVKAGRKVRRKEVEEKDTVTSVSDEPSRRRHHRVRKAIPAQSTPEMHTLPQLRPAQVARTTEIIATRRGLGIAFPAALMPSQIPRPRLTVSELARALTERSNNRGDDVLTQRKALTERGLSYHARPRNIPQRLVPIVSEPIGPLPLIPRPSPEGGRLKPLERSPLGESPLQKHVPGSARNRGKAVKASAAGRGSPRFSALGVTLSPAAASSPKSTTSRRSRATARTTKPKGLAALLVSQHELSQSEMDALAKKAAQWHTDLVNKQQIAHETMEKIQALMATEGKLRTHAELTRIQLKQTEQEIPLLKEHVARKKQQLQSKLQPAKQAIQHVDQRVLTELSATTAPPVPFKDVFAVMLRLLGSADVSWDEVRRVLPTLVERVEGFELQSVGHHVQIRISAIIAGQSESFDQDRLSSTYPNLLPFVGFVRAVMNLLQLMKPLQEQMDSLNAHIAKLASDITSTETEVRRIEKEVVVLGDTYARANFTAEALKRRIGQHRELVQKHKEMQEARKQVQSVAEAAEERRKEMEHWQQKLRSDEEAIQELKAEITS